MSSVKKLLFLLLPVLLLVSGCTGQQALIANPGPLRVQYDIQYDDYSMVGVDLMVMSPDLPSAASTIEGDLFAAFADVSQQLSKSQIIDDQVLLRERLSEAFASSSPQGVNCRIIVMGVNQGTWLAQR